MAKIFTSSACHVDWLDHSIKERIGESDRGLFIFMPDCDRVSPDADYFEDPRFKDNTPESGMRHIKGN